ncbi:MAG TPA: protein kinase [Polyangiaceae bacterium]|nr:protein kinase [Polyangiaceae bacterium]
MAQQERAFTDTTRVSLREHLTEPAPLESAPTSAELAEAAMAKAVLSEAGTPRVSGTVDIYDANLPGEGEIVGDCYRIIAEAGRGGMGVVLQAFDERLNRRVAIKLLHSQLRCESLRERFLTEARTMALVSHPNVASIFAFGEHRGVPYFVMEYVQGSSVEDWLSAQESPPDIQTVLAILDDVCQGVAAIHEAGAIHRDIKPSNLLLDAEGHVRVADFGLAQPMTELELAREVAGTVAYMAPELVFGENGGGASPLSDVYALGCLAYELLTGRLPFDAALDVSIMVQHATVTAPLPSQVRPELTTAFDGAILHALAKKPAERTPSVEEFRRELREARQRFLEPIRILVAEDDEDFRDLLCRKLQAEFPGAVVQCVHDGGEAVRAFDKEPASVVLLDMQMPNLDGVDVTAVLRTRESARQVPIVVMTASGGPAEWKLMSALGADRFLVKPVNLDDLVLSVRSSMKERRASEGGHHRRHK